MLLVDSKSRIPELLWNTATQLFIHVFLLSGYKTGLVWGSPKSAVIGGIEESEEKWIAPQENSLLVHIYVHTHTDPKNSIIP